MKATTANMLPRAHTSTIFSFAVAAPKAIAFPLFGADRERVWASGWAPMFIWPTPAEDRLGMVFQVAHDHGQATWVNTVFDSVAGNVQYVYVLPGVMSTLITISLRDDGSTTEVEVRYERTALAPEADSLVRQMAGHDATAGPEWSSQIATYLATRKGDSH